MTVHKEKGTLFHYNYLIALEEDLSRVSRYIEFDELNLPTYSIELAHLLLASSSEVDVVLKEMCQTLNPSDEARNINDYRKSIRNEIPQNLFDRFVNQSVLIPRYNLDYIPWEKWEKDQNPDWWQSYNAVKHERNIYFSKANLQNVLNSIGALLIVVFHYYWLLDNNEDIHNMSKTDMENSRAKTIRSMKPETTLMKLDNVYYPKYLII